MRVKLLRCLNVCDCLHSDSIDIPFYAVTVLACFVLHVIAYFQFCANSAAIQEDW